MTGTVLDVVIHKTENISILIELILSWDTNGQVTKKPQYLLE